MAEGKNAIIVYADWKKKFESLTDDEAGRLIKHFFRYVNDENPVAPDRITELSFIDIEQSLKRDLKKWENTLEGRSKAGKASAEARKLAREQALTNPTSVESVEKIPTNPTDSVSVSDTVSVTVNVKEDISSRKLKFSASLEPFLKQYGREMLKEFNTYWTEPNKSKTKFKQEMQKTWDTEMRLATWFKRSSGFGSKTETPKPPINKSTHITGKPL